MRKYQTKSFQFERVYHMLVKERKMHTELQADQNNSRKQELKRKIQSFI